MFDAYFFKRLFSLLFYFASFPTKISNYQKGNHRNDIILKAVFTVFIHQINFISITTNTTGEKEIIEHSQPE